MTTLSAIAQHEANLIAHIDQAAAALDAIATDTVEAALARLQAAATRATARLEAASETMKSVLREVLANVEALPRTPSTHQIVQDEAGSVEAVTEPVTSPAACNGTPDVSRLVLALEGEAADTAAEELPLPDVTPAKAFSCWHLRVADGRCLDCERVVPDVGGGPSPPPACQHTCHGRAFHGFVDGTNSEFAYYCCGGCRELYIDGSPTETPPPVCQHPNIATTWEYGSDGPTEIKRCQGCGEERRYQRGVGWQMPATTPSPDVPKPCQHVYGMFGENTAKCMACGAERDCAPEQPPLKPTGNGKHTKSKKGRR